MSNIKSAAVEGVESAEGDNIVTINDVARYAPGVFMEVNRVMYAEMLKAYTKRLNELGYVLATSGVPAGPLDSYQKAVLGRAIVAKRIQVVSPGISPEALAEDVRAAAFLDQDRAWLDAIQNALAVYGVYIVETEDVAIYSEVDEHLSDFLNQLGAPDLSSVLGVDDDELPFGVHDVSSDPDFAALNFSEP